MDSQQVIRVQKLSKGGNFRAWLVHVRAWLMLPDRLDIFLDREPTDDDEVNLDLQARAKLVLCLANEMLPIGGSRNDAVCAGGITCGSTGTYAVNEGAYNDRGDNHETVAKTKRER
jgi:hypothetical protein